MPVIRISKDIAERLKNYKDSPLDTVGSIIERLLDQVEGYEPTPSKGEQMMRIANEPRMRAKRNIESWRKIEASISTNGTATYFELVDACAGHKHEAGGRGFVEYCIDNGWLEYSD
jgi:hypothetical protein